MKLFVGLGNPGAKYAGNRHNIGFMALDRIAADHGFGPWKAAFKAEVSEGRLGSGKVLLVKPQTFMNLSGESVRAAMGFWKLTPADVVVFHDELDLAPGKARVKDGGGHAGHNGLRSIHQHLGTDAYRRVRLGIGHPGHKDAVAAYVLNDFAKADRDWLDDLLRGISDGADFLADGDGARFMNAVALRTAPPRSLDRGSGGGVRQGRCVAKAENGYTGSRAERRADGRAYKWAQGRGKPVGGQAQPDAETAGQIPVTEARIRAAFRSQARACARLGSPLMERLLAGLAEGLAPGSAVADRVLGWPGEAGPAGDSVPLRLAGGLHALVLTGADEALAAAYRRGAPVEAALAALDRHEAHLMHWLNQPPQTNEVRRSAALVAAAHVIAARFGMPLELSELGCSAGLNLLWDRCRLTLPGEVRGAGPILLHPEWEGPLPPPVAFAIAGRAGVDLNPLDPVADRLRLLAYLWPDQPDRAVRTEAALAEVARLRPVLTRGDAAGWLERRLAAPLPGRVHVVFHTIAWQYFPPETQARCSAGLEAAGAWATEAAPMAHLALEADGRADGAALTLRLWPGGEAVALGRACFHGRWVRWAGTG